LAVSPGRISVSSVRAGAGPTLIGRRSTLPKRRAPTTSAPVSAAPSVPEASLAGQAWGWPIPITAGNRPGLPGRPVRRRLTKGADGHYILDALISFGWRAEVMGGFDPADFDATKLVANGVDIWLKDVFTFPGGSVTVHDGLQTTALWADIDGDDAQAYIFHIAVDVRGLPLAQFNDAVPDSWSLHCEDVAGGSSFTGIRPQFGDAHHTSLTVSTTTLTDDTITVGLAGTGLSLDRIPPGKTVWKIYVQAAGTDSRLGLVEELSAGDASLAFTPGFSATGVIVRGDGIVYDGFPRAGPGLTFGSGSYILQAYDSATGKWWVGATDATGTTVTWYGNPAAGTGNAWTLDFVAWSPHAAVYGSGGNVFQFLQPVASEIPAGFTAYVPDPSGITLARWFQLAAGLSYDLKGKVTVATDIDDTLDSFFFVDGQSTFNRDAMAMCEITGCFMREDNASIHIGRGVNGTTYAVDLAVPERRLLRGPGESALTFTRASEQDLPSEIRVQAIASERDGDKFMERPARWERGPKPTSVSTRIETYRVQAGMTVNQMQTYASRTLDRKTEAREQAAYKLPWEDAIKVQPGDIHTVPEDDLLYTLMVTRAERQPNRIVGIQATKLHTAQDYEGLADIGTGLSNPVALPPVAGTITGSITPTGSIHGVFLAEDGGVIVGSIAPVGSLSALVSPPGATGTITGSVTPTGSLTGTAGTPLFALADLANLQALWDADSISGVDNSSIGATAILDSSGNSRNSTTLTGTTATLRTAFLNAHNAIRAAGGSYDVSNFMSGYTQGTMFWVAKTDADNSTNSPPFAFNGAGGTAQHYPYSDNHIYITAGTSSRRDVGAAGSGVLNAWHIVTIRSSGSVYEFRLNGSVLFTTATNTVAFTTTPKFFNALSGSNFLGHLAVNGLYSTAHTQADCEKIEGYLAHRYGLTSVLPALHPYKTSPP
jgi:hypothetical protein